MTGGLEALAARIRGDLEKIAHPRAAWLRPRVAPDGRQAHDAIVVGGGQSGLATAFGLMRAKVSNILVLDRAPRGFEGPWRTYARMRTLRSPKDFTGPDLDLPSLTYQAWHEARYGEAAWQALDLIPREDWAAYLLWMRDVLGLPVRNEVAVERIEPAPGGLLAVSVERADGGRETLHARKVVLATGQEGTGRWWMPDLVARLPRALRAHTADEIDFGALSGKVVAVLGAGASALDNAATALEAGAAEVHLFCRRPEPQLVQPYRWLTFAGFLRHLSELEDPWRWRFMRHILSLREAFPQPTWDRCAAHPAFRFRLGEPWLDARPVDGGLDITTPKGTMRADFAICGTGIDMDFAVRPELAAFSDNIATWGDRYAPPEEERDERLARFPYLAEDYAFTERAPGRTPWIADIHLFAIASTMSFGPSGSSINAMTTAVPKLVHGLTRGLFRGDLDRHWADLQAYDVRQAEIRLPDPAGIPSPTP